MNKSIPNLQQVNDEQKHNDNKEAEEVRERILVSVLDTEARERLKRISLVKEERARKVEDRLIYLAKTGGLQSKVNEKQLIQILEGLAEHQDASNIGSKSKITFSRKNRYDSEEEEEFDL